MDYATTDNSTVERKRHSSSALADSKDAAAALDGSIWTIHTSQRALKWEKLLVTHSFRAGVEELGHT